MKRTIGFCLLLCLLTATANAVYAPPASRHLFPPEAGYEIGFSSGDTALPLILRGIAEARESILVAAYSFTSKTIAAALLEAHRRGIIVQVVADAKANRGRYTAVTFLANRGVPVRLNSHYAIMHHKFMVIDGKHVQTGSFNYSSAAVSKNAENALFLWNVPHMAQQYAAEWDNLWREGQTAALTY